MVIVDAVKEGKVFLLFLWPIIKVATRVVLVHIPRIMMSIMASIYSSALSGTSSGGRDFVVLFADKDGAQPPLAFFGGVIILSSRSSSSRTEEKYWSIFCLSCALKFLLSDLDRSSTASRILRWLRAFRRASGLLKSRYIRSKATRGLSSGARRTLSSFQLTLLHVR